MTLSQMVCGITLTDFLYDDDFSGTCFKKVLKESKIFFKIIASFISKIKDEVIKAQ